jgi:hypothetical protein
MLRLGIFGFRRPRGFTYQPLYYSIEKDEKELQKRKIHAAVAREWDPVVHGKTVRDRMQERISSYRDREKYQSPFGSRLILFFLLLVITALIWYASSLVGNTN